MIRVPILAVVLAAGLAVPNDAGRLDITFPGGSLADYITTIRGQVADVNIVDSDLAAEVRIEPVQLKKVTVDAALRLIDDLRVDGPRGFYLVDVVRLSGGADENPVYRVETEFRQARGTDPVSRVWMLAAPMDDGLEPSDVLTAIEAALELFDDSYGRAQLRFHAETGILIARGHPEQIQSIDYVASALLSHWTPARRPDDAANVAELTKCLVRAEMLTTELEHRREEFTAMRAEYDQELRDRDALIRKLTIQLETARPPGAAGPR